ncbi:MAG: hypothetical protein LBG73_07680 [Spirochaetaceae bacterium]|nr:hypothetical protein [Spirochaetaceae bacterium]
MDIAIEFNPAAFKRSVSMEPGFSLSDEKPLSPPDQSRLTRLRRITC